MGNIVWVSSYPKSGNTWVRTFIENYIQDLPTAVNINTLHQISTAEAYSYRFADHLAKGKTTTELSMAEVCAIRPRVQSAMASEAQGSLFVKTHNILGNFEGYPLHNSTVTAGAIYIVRNPLDVVISLANYFDYTIDEAISYMAEEMTGTPNEPATVPQYISSWSVHAKSWTQHKQKEFLILRYEDLLDNPQKMFKKVESFLGMKKNPARLNKAIRFSSFEQLKNQEKQSGFVEKHENANSFFREGRKNQWRSILTPEQVKKIISDHFEQMKEFKYIPKEYKL
ncbi:sulfotransferase domain-containing protein [Pseudoalteromonas denitrificans]|uniref:Sulfotransferase domain-containing protein n=1 Tax=Pseudoalteromonas denitrificans DSM 6059 TaxID=1123010 RepID=A0A1I1I951_9GAMM|nr:sulfotransferase domain-containing protein [Pseudoalteromonas denitrificans]SFC29780.1 Sulfotransferase domain-containing protein [Pseudoalteromonas denitrificans DSM 6059]